MEEIKVTNEKVVEYGIRLLYAIAGIFISTVVFVSVATWQLRGIYDDFRNAQAEREMIRTFYDVKLQGIEEDIRDVDQRVTKTTGRNASAIKELENK